MSERKERDLSPPPLALRALLLTTLVLPVLSPNVHADLDLGKANPRTLDDCDALVRDHPKDLEAYRCYYVLARRSKLWADATRRLDALLARSPDNPRALLYLGQIELDLGRERAASILERAVAGFAREGDPSGEVWAREVLCGPLLASGRLAEAESQLDRAAAVAAKSGKQELVLSVDVARARQAYAARDYGRALSLFREAEDGVFPRGTPYLQGIVLNGLGNTSWALGRNREAMEYYRREADHWRKQGALYDEATARYNIALVARPLATAKEITTEEWRRLVSEALATSVSTGNRRSEAAIRLQLAEGPGLALPDRIDEAERAVAILRELQGDMRLCFALRQLAVYRHGLDPQRTERYLPLLDEAVALARSRGDVAETALGLLVRGSVRKDEKPSEWMPDMLAGLDAVERIRGMQRDDLVRARVFAPWSRFYYRICGALLEGSPSRDDLASAFAISERMRAGLLLDLMDAAKATGAVAATDPLQEERRQALDEIARVQKGLPSPTLTDPARASALEALDRLENRERGLRDRISRSDPGFAALRKPEIPSLADLQGALLPDEAMVSFLLSTKGGPREEGRHENEWGGSWAVVVTPERALALPLGERDDIEAETSMFLALLVRRDEEHLVAASRLYRDLVSAVVEALPEDTRKLVVVPDGSLHRLPFEALRPSADAEPLGARYEISMCPSAAVWYRLRKGGAQTAPVPVLALADPDVEYELGRLPLARKEAEAVVGALGGGSRALFGRDASERLLKTSRLADYRILHLAAHAVVDGEHPERSAIVLAPGADEEDGLVQMREIVGLDLAERVVILSACSGASGEVLEGEGVMSLARAFFQAGARTVLGSLYPLRDDEAAALVTDVSRNLAEGVSMGTALARAHRSRMRAGAPAGAWAGLVLLGDGEVVPMPGGRGEGAARSRLGLAALALVLLASAVLVARHLRSRSRPV